MRRADQHEALLRPAGQGRERGPGGGLERVKPQIEADVLYATWHRDFVAGGIGGGRGRFCSMPQIRCALPAARERTSWCGGSTPCSVCQCLA